MARPSGKGAAPARGPRAWWKHPWALAMGLAAVALAATFDPKLYINGDNVDYMFLARSIRAGNFWPSDKFPPLFPLLLAGVQSLFGLRLIPQKLLVLAMGLVSLWLLARVVRRRLPEGDGPWVFLVAGTLIPIVEFSHYEMSEIPYFCFLLGAIDAADRWLGARAAPSVGARPGVDGDAIHRDPASAFREDPGWSALVRDRGLWILGLWIGATFYTRSAGLALGAAVLAVFLRAGRRRAAAALAAIVAVFLIPWILHTAATPGGSPYLRQLFLLNPYYPEFGPLTPASFLRRLVDNGKFYLLEQTPVAVLPFHYASTYSAVASQLKAYPAWLALPLLVPVLVGLRSGLRRADAAAWTVLATLALSCLWPLVWAGSRFLLPVVPLLLLFWWLGLRRIAAFRSDALKVRFRWAVLTLLLLLSARNLVLYVRETRAYPPEWERYFAALQWVRAHTPQDAVIIDRKPGFVRWVAERESLTFPREKDPDKMLAFFRAHRATHVILSSLPYDDIGRYLRDALQRRIDEYSPVFETEAPWTYVLQIAPAETFNAPEVPSRPGPPGGREGGGDFRVPGADGGD
jgi:hypothetical protein